MAKAIRPSDKTDPSDKTTVLQGDQGTLEHELQKAKEQEACLIIIRGTPQGHRFFLSKSNMNIGRDPDADISVSDQSISRKHAQIHKKNGKVYITDLGSANGTFINDKKISKDEKTLLSKEDMIKLGNSILKFLPAGQLEILFYGNLGSAAHTDGLTKIYNKSYLLEALDAEFKRARALHTDFSILFFDIDFFKKLNDTCGHDCGDYVLKELARIVKNRFVKPKDIFARYGGEEFVLLLANTSLDMAVTVAEQMRQAIEHHPFMYEGKKLTVTVSAGVACLTTETDSPTTLIKAADKALYVAKNNGRNQVSHI
ncbi:MAG: GGDEF domain-containing protein [Bdellovibrio sp.]|nr:GGDEF domain-containing protein [Bdellovibrio sp.]